MQDTQNAWRYDIQCMKSPTKIERIRSRTKRAKQLEMVDKLVLDIFNVSLELPPSDNTKKVDEKDPRVTAIISRLLTNHSW